MREKRDEEDWEDLIYPINMAYNSSVHSGTGQTPHFLWHGREMRIPLDLQMSVKDEEYQSTSDFAIKLVDRIKDAYDIVNMHFQSVALREENAYARRPQIRDFEVGQTVLYFTPYMKPGASRKMNLHFTGPFRIINKISSILYEMWKTRPVANLF